MSQAQILVNELGLIFNSAVNHFVFNLPDMQRGDYACPLKADLEQLPGAVRAAVNPAARTVAIEYLDSGQLSRADLLETIRSWGYRARELRFPRESWERFRLAAYTGLTGAALAAAWILERAGSDPLLVVAFAGLAYLAGGGFAAASGWRSLRRGRVDVDTLMVSAALGAAALGQWLEGGVLLFLFALSNALEAHAMDRTRHAIRALMDLRPQRATVMRRGVAVEVPVEELEVGDRVLVQPGDRVPADGQVEVGESAVDQAPITGESLPVRKTVGDMVFAGTINGHGSLEVHVFRRAEDTTLARLIQLVETAQNSRAPTQRRLDNLERAYALAVISAAAAVALLSPWLLHWNWSTAFYKSMTLLVVASPCALVISTPAAILSAIAAGARRGVLFKGGASVETMARVQAIAFDKTGTLTIGKPRVTDLKPRAGWTEGELLSLAASVESRSEHPLAQAVVSAAAERDLHVPEAAGLQATPGRGVTARMNGDLIHIGTTALLEAAGYALSPEERREMDELEGQGKTVLLVAISPEAPSGPINLVGLIAVADSVRPEARQAVADLKSAGVQHIVMLTGDNARAAQAIAKQVGLDEARSELLPEEKVAIIAGLRERFLEVAMVGDGVNDAPALASASLGIAIGAGGSDVALEAADVVLMAGDLSRLPFALNLSRRARRIVRQNLAISLGVILLLIISTFAGWISLSSGVLGHEGSTVLVVLNGLRLLRGRPH